MKKNRGIIIVAAFALVILGALAVAGWYQLKCITHLQEEVYVVRDADVAKNLLRGRKPENSSSELFKVDASEPVYQRGGSLYVGQGKEKVEAVFPFFANNGEAVMLVKNDQVLLDKQFEEVSTFPGMYVSDGLSFNYDKSQADDESYLFLKLSNGLFMNAQFIQFDYPGGQEKMRMNSIFCFERDAVRYYSMQPEHSLWYGELPTVNMLMVTIGGETYSYEQFLGLLGLLGKDYKPNAADTGNTSVSAETGDQEEEVREEENNQDIEEESELSETERTGADKEKEDTKQTGNKDKTEAEKQAKEKNKKEKKKNNQQNGGSSGTGNSSTTGGSSTGGNGDSNTGSGTAGTENNGGESKPTLSGDDLSGNDLSGNDLSGNDVSGSNPGFIRPDVSLDDFTADIYSIFSTLRIDDPAYVMKRVVIELYWQPVDEKTGKPAADSSDRKKYDLRYRKTFRSAGDIELDNLPPDTTIYAKGTVYYMSRGETESFEFYDGFESRVRTKPMDDLDDIYLTFNNTKSDADVKVLPHQMQIFDLAASGPNPNVLDKVSRVQIIVTGTDALHKGETYSCLMSITDFRNRYCYTGEPEMEPAVSDDVSGNDVSGNDVSGNDVSDNDPGGSDDGVVKPRVDWTSVREAMDLPSNMKFTYEIKLLDSFGNAFTKIVDGYHGKARKTADGEAVDWKVEKSLTCCEKKEVEYYTPRGDGYTSKTEPSIVMKQAAFEDNEHNIDRAKYEITMLDPDAAAEKFKNNYYMELYMEDEDGLITESALPVECFYEVSGSPDTRQKTSRFYLPSESIVHNAVKQYEITGLTAGKIYELRIYGYYELNDQINAEADITKPAQLINSQRFSTADLSSLGSVMYTLANKHVKTEIWPNGSPQVSKQPDGSVVNEISPYESATAQELSMQINYGYNMTNRKLSEMISEIYVEVKDTTKEGEDAVIMSAVLDRDKLENALYTGTGDMEEEKRFELNLADLIKDGTQVKSTLKDKDGTPYIPKLYLETQDMPAGTTEKVWNAFVSETTKAKLVFFWEDGSLTSNTSYRLDVQTLARQGGLNHDVTARGAAYRSLNFTTLKKMPYVTWDSILIVSDYIKIEGLDFHDEDNSILEGMAQKSLFGYTNGLPFSIESGNEKIIYLTADEKYGLLELLEYNGLVIGDDYRVDLAPATIRRDSAGRYTLRRHNLFSYRFTAGAGLSGRLVFESIDYPLEQIDGVQYRRDEFRLYNAGGYSMGASFGSTGTVSDTGSNSYSSWAVSPFIPVKAGGLYYIDGIRGNSHSSYWMSIAFYTNKNEADENATPAALIDRDTWKVSDVTTGRVQRTFYISPSDNVIKIPAASDGGSEIRYMRFNMLGRDTSTYITAYAVADCFVLDDGDKKVEGAVEKIDSAKFVRESTSNSNWYYKLENDQAVTPGEKYVVGNGVHRYTCTFKDESGTVIKTVDSGQYMVSPVFTVPEGAAKMTLRTYNNSSYRGGLGLELYRLNTDKLAWLRSRDIDKFANSLTVKVEDKLDNLIPEGNREVFLEVWQVNADGSKVKVDLGGGKMEMQVTADEQNKLSTLDFEQLVSFDGSSNKKFEMELYVKYNGDKITLDTMEFETNRTLECIHDRTELAKLMRYPSGDFIVVNDIELRNNEGFYFGNGSNTPFRGTLDFQGHSMTVNGGWTGISTVESGGVIKNLSLRSRRNGSTSSNYGLVTTNRGTLQNIVMELDLGEGMYRKDNVSGLCNANYGTIENFSLYYTGTSSMYVGYYFGGLCRENYGVIKNGYAYCPGTLSVTTAVYGGSTARSCAYSSLLVSRSWGDIKNVYVVGDLSVERYTDDGSLPYNALLTRVESGLVSNCISVGDFNRIIWTGSATKTRLKQTYTTYGPMVAGNISATSTSIKNNYYYSNVAEPYAKNYAGVQEQVKDAALFQDSSFYDRTINSESAFEMADISSGYFPRVTMPYDELMMRQQKAPLVASSSDISTSYAFARVDEIYRENDVKNSEAKDYANVTLMFRNRLEREINDVTIDGLKVEPRDGYVAEAGNPQFEQYTEGGYYIVKVKLSVDKNRENEKGEREVLYRKKYNVTGFTFNQTYNAEVKNRQIELMFPRLVTQDNWVMGYDTAKKQWLTVFEDMQGCYRLGTDIDYTKFSSEDITGPTGATPKNRRQAAMEVFARRTGNQTTFYGSLDGQDVKDETKQYALKNFRLGKGGSSYVYLINSAQGAELKNLKIENLTIDQDGFTTAYGGLVSISGSDSRYENIVIQNVTLSNVYRWSGALIGQSGFATVQDCVLRGFRAESRASAASDFRIGGFIGYADRGGRLENCYAAEVRINALKGTSSDGVGALIGAGYNNPWIINCYAQGKIDSSFQYTGGLIGRGGIISGTWSKVNVTSANRYTGGISGSGSTIKNTLVLGEVFCSAPDSYNRVSSGSAKLASCFVSELQKLNSVAADTDSGDAEGIMTVEEMKKEFWYWDKLNMGKAFDYTVVESGNLPRLKYKDGHDILPLQELYMIEPASVPFTAEGLAEDNFAPDWAAGAAGSDDSSTEVHEYDLSVTLKFRYEDGKTDPSNGNVGRFKELFRGADGEAYGRLSIEDMDFVKTDGVVKEVESSYAKIDGVPTYSLTFKVTPERYLDSYRVVWDTGQDQENAMLVFQKVENGEKKDMILYRYIYRVRDTAAIAAAYQAKEGIYADPGSWQGAMRLAGDSLENFKIMEDLDFSGIKSVSDTAGDEYLILKTALKINRLEGAHQNFSMGDKSLTEWDRREYLMSDTLDNTDADLDFVEIRNLNFETNSSGVNWISELRADMRYLRFRGIEWTGSGSNTGVVRSLRGNLAYIDIDRFILRYKSTGDYMGFFISSSGNKAEYLRGRNIQVRRQDSVTNTIGAASYVGGIFANSSGLVQHAGIKGAAPAAGEDKNDATKWTYRIEGRLPSVEDKDNKNYTGGLGGSIGGSGLIFAYAENIYVEGNGYVGAISGSQTSYGNYEEAQFKAVQTEGKDTVYLHEVENCYIRGKNYVGGITGNGGPRWSISKNNEIYAVNVRAGGVAGGNSGYYNRAIDCIITAQNGYAGGLAGTSGAHYNRSEVQGCVISAPRYVGGMAPSYGGSGGNYNGGTVHDSIIWGEEYVGGIWGYSDDTGVSGAFVGNCYIGSQGVDNIPQLIKNDDGTYQIKERGFSTETLRADSAKGMHIGGIIGYSCGGRVTNTLVDDDVRIYGKDFVGGVIGDGGGGAKVNETGSANIESGANVYVSGSYGGGYTGRLVGFEQSSKGPDILNRPVTKIDKVIITGKVTASANAEYIGAFAGCYRVHKEGLDNDGRPLDPEKGFKKNDLDTGYREYMSSSYIRRVTLALTEVSGGRDPQLIGKAVRLDGTETIVNQGAEHELVKLKSDNTIERQEKEYEGIGYLRVYGAMRIGNSTAKAKYPSWASWNYTGGEMPEAEKAKIVTTADLKRIDFYYAPLMKGGQEMRAQGEGNVKYFENDGRTYRFYYFYYRNENEGDTANPTTTIFPYITYSGSETRLYVYERQLDGTTQKQCQFGIPIPEDGIMTTFLDVSEALDYVSTYASGAGSVNLEFPEILVTEEPAGEEGIMLMLLEDETVQNAEVTAGAADALRKSAADILPTAGVTQKAASGTLRKASGMSGTSAVKAASGIMTMADMEEDAEDIAAESTEEVITPVSYFQIYDENGALLYEDRIGKQVYTIPYDFEKTLTVKVFAGNETRSYMLTGETLKHTVMTWNDHCYYLKSDGIYRDKGVYTDDGSEGEKDYANTEKVREGAFLHLYQGEALDEEGNIIDVVSGKSTEKLDTETLYLPAEEEIPAYETSYGGEEILTYRTFSTTQDDEVVSDYRLFAHNDKLFGMDPELDRPYGEKFWNFVADYYSTSKGSTEYLSVLNENYVLEDYKTALNWPVEEKSGKSMLRNYQIREVGDNLNADRSYVIIRYYDNTAAAFDYLTGSLLFVDDSEKKELGFVEFANMWLLGKKESLNNANAYLGAKGLVEKLSENPVDDDLVAGYLANQALKGGNAEADEERTDLAIDGTNDADGSSMLSGADSRNPDFGVNISGTESESRSEEGAQGTKGTEIVNTTGNGSADKAQGDTAIGEGMSAPVQSTGNAEASGTGIAGAGNEIVVDMTGDAAGGNGSDNASSDTAGTGIGKGDRESAGSGAGTGAGEGTGTGIGKETGTGADIKDGVGTGAGEGAGTGIGAGDGTAEKENGIAGAGGNGIAGDGKETGMTDTGAADAGAETKDQKEASETGDGAKKDAAVEDSALPDPTSDRAYVTMLTADAGGYEVFRATELLSTRGSAAMSENQKIKLLEASGLLQNTVDLESMKLTSEENRTGLILVGTAAATMMLLLGLLYYKKRKMNQMM